MLDNQDEFEKYLTANYEPLMAEFIAIYGSNVLELEMEQWAFNK